MATDRYSLPDTIHRRLRSLETQIRALTSIRGLGIGVAVCAAVIGTCVLLDWCFDLPRLVRFGLLGLFITAVAFCVVRYIVLPLLQRFDANELATLLESGNPELKERVSSAIELSDESVPEEHRGSGWMRSQLRRRTAKAADSMKPSNAVSTTASLRAVGLGLLALVILALPFGIWPSSSKLMAARFFQPWENLDRPTNLYFQVLDGNRVIAHGSDARIVAIPHWREAEEDRPETVLVNWSFTDGDSGSKRMRWDEGDGAYVAEIRHVVADFDYHIAADSARSKNYHINAVIAPMVDTLLLDVEPPAYSGLPAEHHDGIIGEVRAFERSNLRFSLTFNKPVTQADFHWFSDAVPEGTPPQTFEMQLGEDGLAASFETSAMESGKFLVRLRDANGLANEDEEERELSVVKDGEPDVQFADQQQPHSARPDAVVPVSVVASDDIGVGELSLHYYIEETEAGSIPFAEINTGARRVAHVFAMDLSKLDIPEGTAFSYRIRAADERPIPDPNVSWTSDRKLIISDTADSLTEQELSAHQQQIADQIREIREQVADDRKEARELKTKLQKASRSGVKLDEDMQLSELASDEFKLSEQLEAVSQELEKHPLFKELAERAQDVSRKDIPKASEELGKAAREPQQNRKIRNVNDAEKALNQAEWKLRNLEERFNDLADLERDIARLDQLAQDTDKLADNVEQLEKDRAAQNAQQDQQGEEDQKQDLVDRQNELLDQQQQLADNLDELAEKRPELVDAARKAQLDRLKEVAKEARELANQEQHLANSFQNEANQNRQESRSTMQKAVEVQREAERLKRELSKQGLQSKVDPKSLQQAVQDLQQGNIEQPEQAMRDAAEQLEKQSQDIAKANGDQSQDNQAGAQGDQADSGQKEAAKSENQYDKLSAAEREELSETTKRTSEKAREVADALKKLREERQAQGQASTQQSEADRKRSDELAQKQQALADEAQKLAEETKATRGRDDPATQQAQQAAQQAKQAASQAQAGQQQDAAESAKQASGSEESSSQELGQETDARSQELSKAASQLAKKQQELAQEMQATADQQAAAQQQNQAKPTLAQKQQDLADKAERLADITEADRGKRDSASRSARQAAQQAQQAADLAQAGLHRDAARAGQQAAQKEQNSGKQLGKQGDARSQKLSESAQALAEQQEQLAKQMKDLEKDPSASRQARQEGQQEVAQKMEQLAKELAEASEQLKSNPVDMPSQGDKAQQAQQSARQAQQKAQQASEQSQQSNSKQASNSARDAARKMQEAANKAQQASNGNVKKSPVPEDVGEQFAKAMKSVKEAGKELGQKPGTQETGDQSGKGQEQGQQPSPGEGEGEGEQGEGQKGKGQGQGEGEQGQEPGQTPDKNAQQGNAKPNGQQPGKSKGMGSQQLRDAAKQMSKAARNALPRKGEGQTGEQGVSKTGENTEPGGNPEDPQGRLEELLGGSDARDWGKLPGHLQTDILQGATKNANGDYAKLIRSYFREIAKATDQDSNSNTVRPKAGK